MAFFFSLFAVRQHYPVFPTEVNWTFLLPSYSGNGGEWVTFVTIDYDVEMTYLINNKLIGFISYLCLSWPLFSVCYLHLLLILITPGVSYCLVGVLQFSGWRGGGTGHLLVLSIVLPTELFFVKSIFFFNFPSLPCLNCTLVQHTTEQVADKTLAASIILARASL